MIPRRQILVDRSFQLSFLRLWLTVGLGLVVLSAAFYFFARQFLGSKQIDPIILRVILGMGAFILIFSALMGTLSIVLAHRVAGAAYRLEKSLDRILEGDISEVISLRKGDYLTRLAERLSRLQERLRQDRAKAVELTGMLVVLRDQVPADQRPRLDEILQKLRTLASV